MFIILEMPSVEELTVSSDSSVSFARLLSNTLLLFNKVHWFAKNNLKGSAFSLKFVINLFSRSREAIQGIFYYSQRFLKWTNIF